MRKLIVALLRPFVLQILKEEMERLGFSDRVFTAVFCRVFDYRAGSPEYSRSEILAHVASLGRRKS